MKNIRKHPFLLETLLYIARNKGKMAKNGQKSTKITIFRHVWLKFGIYFAFNQAKMNKTCRINQIYVKSIIFNGYESIILSNIIKKCQKLAKMAKNRIFGHFWRLIVKKYEFSQL